MLADHVLADLGGTKTQQLLTRLDQLIPWDQLALPILPLYRNDDGRGGRPNVPVVMMLTCILLQKWFNLSDPGLEEAVADRISFRKFLNLGLSDQGVDETTLVKFRKRLREAGVISELFDTATNYLTSQGLILKQGTMVDATIMAAPRGKATEDGLDSTDQIDHGISQGALSWSTSQRRGLWVHGHGLQLQTEFVIDRVMTQTKRVR